MIKTHSSCPQGLTESDLDVILGERLPEFMYWMRGQTVSACDGREYNHGHKSYFTTSCSGMMPGMPLGRDEVPGGHGMVVYPWDLERFLAGLPVID
jgi:hypothetical protein